MIRSIKDGGERFFDTSKLPDAIAAWLPCIELTVAKAAYYHECFSLARVLLDRTAIHNTNFNDNIVFSIASVVVLLDKAVQEAFRGSSVAYEGVNFSPGLHWSQDRIDRMIEAGWCTYEAKILPSIMIDLPVLFLCSKHQPVNALRRHNLCIETRCKAFEIQFNQQRGSTHRDPDC